jgi:hypothetical protein
MTRANINAAAATTEKRKHGLRGLPPILLIVTVAVLLADCPGTAGGGLSGGGGFELVSGSGTVSVRILGANSGGHNGETFYFGTNSTPDPMGGELVIGDDDETGIVESGAVITGGLEIEVGGFIDVNGNAVSNSYMADNNDYLSTVKTITVSGNETVTLTYSTDFTLVTGSGTVSVQILGADTGGHGGETFYFGTVSTGTAMGGEVLIVDDDDTGTIEGGVVFTGGLVLEVGGFIDVNGNAASNSYMADDGDYLSTGKTITVSGNETVTLTYPGDFTLVSGSGRVYVNLTGAGEHSGKKFHFGTDSTGTPLGGDVVIDSDSVMELIESGVIFTGGLVLEVGGFIDVNGNAGTFKMADNGDYLTTVPDITTVAGDSIATIQYE